MHTNTRRRLKITAAVLLIVVLIAIFFLMAHASSTWTKTGPGGTVVSETSSTTVVAVPDQPAPTPNIPKPTWINFDDAVWSMHDDTATYGSADATHAAAVGADAATLRSNTQTRLLQRLGATSFNLLAAFGPGRNGQVLTYVNGKIEWKDVPVLHGAAGVIEDGSGRRPESFIDGVRHYGGGGGSSTTTVVVSGGGGTGDLTQANADGRYVNVTGDTMNGGLTIAYDGLGLNITGTASGDTIHAEKHLSVSGTTVFDGNARFNSSLTINSVTYSFPASDGAGSGKVLKSDGNGNLSWADDNTVGTGLSIATGDQRYVKKQGDTMTGALVIDIRNGALGTVGLKIVNTLSGANIHAERSLSTSGSLVFEGSASGSSLYIASSLQGAGLTDCDAASQTLNWDAATGRFSCGTDTDTDTQFSNTGSLQAAFDNRYVNTSGDTMTGALSVRATLSGSRLVISNNANISGSLLVLNNITARGTLSGSRLVVSGHANISGSLLVLNNITTRGTLSGANLTVSKSASISGSLLVKTSITSKGSVSGATIFGFGLGSCSGAGQKLSYNNSTGVFGCASDVDTDTQFSNTGSLQTAFDARYVNTSGDTMTGALSVRATLSGARLVISNNANISGSLLVLNNITARGTLSGTNLTVSSSASISGALLVKTSITSKGSVSGSTLLGFGLGSCTGASQKLLYNSSTNKFECGTITASTAFSTGNVITIGDARYVNASGDTMTGALSVRGTLSGSRLVISGNANITGSLLVLNDIIARGTLSGTKLTVSSSASISGALLVKTSITSKGSLSGSSFYGAGLGTCNGSTQKVVYDAATGKFSCATDQTGGSGTFGTGNVIVIGDARYVNASGDTMTGALSVRATLSGSRLVISGNANITGSLLVVGGITSRGTISGSVLHASATLSSSGGIVFEGTASGSSLYIASSLQGVGLTDCDAASQTLNWDSSTGRFSCGTDQDTQFSNTGSLQTAFDARYVNQSGDTVTGSLLVKGNLSGARLIISQNANISGSLLVLNNITTRGNLSGSTLTVSSSGTKINNIQYYWPGYTYSGGYLRVSANGTLQWTTVPIPQTPNEVGTAAFSGAVRIISDARYVNVSGDTMTGSLSVRGNLSGSTLNISASGTNIRNVQYYWPGYTYSGGYLRVSGDGRLQWTTVAIPSTPNEVGTASFTGAVQIVSDSRYVNISGDTMTGALSVRGTLSGSRLVVSGNANITGSLLVLNNIVARGTISGSVLHASATLSSSGGVVWEGMASGSSLYIGTSLRGAGLTDCTGGNKLLWDATSGRFSCAADQSSGSGLDQNAGDARYVRKSGDTMTGALVINVLNGNINTVGLKVVNTLSGANLHAERTLSTSGSLVFEGSASGSSLYIATSIQGAGLTDCDAATQTLNWDASTGRFSCGTDLDTDTQFSNTGSLQTAFDARYVNQSGDTVTGSLLVKGNLSGARLVISGNANITGSLLVLNGITTRGTLSGSRLVVSGHANISGALLVLNSITTRGTLSGANLTVSKSASISGSLLVKTSIASKGSVSGATIFGFGLGSCSGANQKLVYNNSTNVFGCASDVDTDTNTQFSNTGSLQLAFDSRYVNTSGDTMTGSLSVRATLSGSRLVISGNANITGSLLVVGGITSRGTISGSVLHASATLTSSGGVVWEGMASGSSLYLGTSLRGAGLTDCTGGNKLLWDATSGRFSCAADQSAASGLDQNSGDARYVRKSGGTMTGALVINLTSGYVGLRVLNTASGAVFHAEQTLSSSGSLVFEGSASGASLYIATSIQGAGLTDCDAATQTLNWDAATGRFSCGTDLDTDTQFSNTGSLQTAFDNRYLNQSGDTMTGALVINLTSGFIGLRVINTASGNIIHAEKDLTSSGTLIVNGATRLKSTLTILGTLTGNVLHAEKSLSSSGTLVFEGAASGSSLYIATSFDGAGLADCDTAGTSKLLWDSTSKRFSCGTDTDTNTQWSNTGALQTAFDSRYVNVAGDTMTGTLVLQNGNTHTATNTPLLNVRGTMSGRSLIIAGTGASTAPLIYTDVSTGRVGIGTSAPSAILELRSDTDANAKIRVVYTGTPATNAGGGAFQGYISQVPTAAGQRLGNLQLGAFDSSNTARTSIGVFGYAGEAWGALASRAGYLTFETTPLGSVTRAERVRIDTNGYMGVGTTTPKAQVDVLGTISGSRLSISNNANISGSLLSIGNITTRGTLSGSRLVVSGHGTISGSLLVLNNITARGTLSGTNLTVSSSASISGTLIVKTGITSKGSVSGSTILGFGLGSCTGASQKLLYNNATNKFECGTISASASFSTGNVLTIGDARYVKKSGDTMTGALVINVTNGALGTLGLRVINTFSGAVVHAEKTLTSSGTVVTNSGYLLSAARNQVIRMQTGTGTGKNLSILGATGSGGYAGGAINIEAGTSVRVLRGGSSSTPITLVQKKSAASDTTPVAVTWDSTTTAGNLLVAVVTNKRPGPTSVPTITPPAGWTLAKTQTTDLGNGHRWRTSIYYIENASARSGSESFTGEGYMGSAYMTLALFEYSGILTSGALDQTAGASAAATTDTTANSGTTGTTAQADELVIATFSNGASAFGTPTNSFTARETPSSVIYTTVADKTLTATDTPSTSATHTASSNVGAIATFKAIGGGVAATAYVSTAGSLTLNAGSGSSPVIIIGNKYSPTVRLVQSGGAVAIGKTTPSGNAKLDVLGTISGSRLVISNNANISGSLLSIGNIVTRGTMSGNRLVVSSNANISGSLVVLNGITSRGTFSGSRLVVSGHANISGALLVLNNITTRGTLSGANLTVSKSASISGSLLVKTSIASKGSVSGATIFGFGLGSCSGAGQKLVYNNSTNVFGCASDVDTNTQFSNTGSLQVAFDSRYVNQSGDTMTGALTIGITNGSISTVGLKVINTLSGARLHAERELSSSGTFVLKNRAGTATGNIFVIDTSGLIYDATNKRVGVNTTSPDAAMHVVAPAALGSTTPVMKLQGSSGNSSPTGAAILHLLNTHTSANTMIGLKFDHYNASSAEVTIGTIDVIPNTVTAGSEAGYMRFATRNATAGLIERMRIGNDGDIGIGTTTAGSRLSVSGAVIIGTAIGSAAADTNVALEIIGTASGRVLRAQDTLASSGTLVFEGAASGSSLYVATSFDGAGLADCDTAGSSKLLWDATSKRFSCGTDQTGGASSNWSNTGSLQAAFDTRYVNVAGDTMTGVLIIQNGNTHTATNTPLLNVRGTMSGRGITITGTGGVPLLATNQERGTLYMGTGANRNMTGGSVMYPQLNVTGRLPRVAVGSGSTGSGPYGIYVQDRYAYIVNYTSSTMQIFDVSNVGSPVLMSTVASGTQPYGVYVQGRYAYVANTGSDTVTIFDITNPKAPAAVSTITTGDQPYSVYVQGRYAYVTAYGDAALQIYDISNPKAVTRVGSVGTGTNPWGMTVRGNYVYLVNAGASRSLQIIDASDPYHPAVKSSLTVGLSPSSVAVQGNYAYVTNYSSSSVHIIDIRDPSAPLFVSAVTTGTQPYHVVAQGRYIYVATAASATLNAIDVSNPAAPYSVGTVATGGGSGYVYVQGRYAYVTNNTGKSFQIFDLGGAYVQQLEAGSLEAGSLSVRQNIFAADINLRGGMTVGTSLQVIGNASFGTGGLVQINQTGSALNVRGVLSGSRLVISNNATISGALVVMNDITTRRGFSGNTLFINKNATFGGSGVIISGSGAAVFNEQSRNVDFRIESDGDVNAFFVDASTDFIGVGKSNPKAKLDVFGTISGSRLSISGNSNFSGAILAMGNVVTRGSFSGNTLFINKNAAFANSGITISLSGATVFNEQSNAVDFRIESDGDVNAFFVDASTNNIGIGKNNPKAKLDVLGTISGSSLTISGNASVSGALTVKPGAGPNSVGLNVLATMSGRALTVSGTGGQFSPLLTTNVQNGVMMMGTGGIKNGTGSLAPQLYIAGRLPNQATGSGSSGAMSGVYIVGRYAYTTVSSTNRLQVWDISNPRKPLALGTTPTGTKPRGIFVQGRYAYLTNSGSNTLQIVDVSNPSVPVPISSLTVGSGPQGIDVQGRYAYVVGSSSANLRIVDISNPYAPTITASLATGTQPVAIDVQGRYAYVANVGSNTVQIFDVSKPAAPVSVSTVTTGTGPRALSNQGRYLYVVNSTANSLQIIDVANPASATVVSTTTTGTNPSSVFVQGRYVFVTNHNGNTLQMFDVSNPSVPVSLGTVATGTSPSAVYVQGRYAYVVTGPSRAMQVFDLGGSYIQQLEAGGLEANTLSVRTSLQAMDANLQGGVTVGQSLNVIGNASFGSGGVVTVGSYTGVALNVRGMMSGSTLRVFNGTTATGAFISQRANGTALDILSTGTTTDVINVEARGLTTGLALDIYGSALTTGGLARFYSNSTSALTRSLVAITNNSSSASKTTPFRILQAASYTGAFIDMNGNAPALDIDSESTTQPGIRVDMPSNYASENPHLLFGYNGTFDTNFMRYGANQLGTSGSLIMNPTAFTAVFTDTDSDPTTGIGTDYTTEAKTSSGTPIPMFTAENPTNEYFYVGLPTKFAVVNFNTATPGTTIVFQAQYYNTAGVWTELPFTDGTSNLSQDGTVTFNPPAAWAANAGIPAFPTSLFYVRFHSIATNITKVPNLYSVAPTQESRLTIKSQAGDNQPLLYINNQKNVVIGSTTAARGNAILTVSGGVMIAPGVTTPRLDQGVALEVVGTISGTRLDIAKNATISGALFVMNGIKTRGTLSGNTLFINKNATFANSGVIISLSGATVFNEQSNNVDFRIESDGDANAFFVDASADFIGIGKSNPKTKLDVLGTLSGSVLTINSSSTANNYVMGLFGVGDATPNGKLEVSGVSNSRTLTLANTAASDTNTRFIDAIRSGSDSEFIVYNNGDVNYDGTASAPADYAEWMETNDIDLVPGELVSLDPSRAHAIKRSSGANDQRLFGVISTKPGILGTRADDVTDATIERETDPNWKKVAFLGQVPTKVTGLINIGDPITSSATPGVGRKATLGQSTVCIALEAFTGSDIGVVNCVLARSNLSAVGQAMSSGSYLHARELLSSSGALAVETWGSFGSGILLNTAYTNGNADIFVAKSNVGGTGNTVLRINASGAVFSDSTFNSQGADYAEWFKSTDSSLKAGEVVCIDILNTNAVKRCDRGGDTNVMGIISTNPAFIGNAIRGADGMKGVTGYVLVGLIGQVPAKVTLEGGAIRPGDSLTAASLPGYARRAAAGESTVGVALEGYDGATNKNIINVLISRKNSSLTVETVNQKVLESIASMNIGDEITRLVANASQTLTGSIALTVQSQITALDIQSQIDASIIRRLSGSLISFADFGSGMTILNTRIAVLESRVTALEATLSGAVLHGAATVDTLTVSTLRYTGALILSGSGTRIGNISFSGSEVQIGSLMSSGSLKVMGNVTISGLATFLGDVHVAGELSVSTKQAGIAVIPQGGTGVTVTFSGAFIGTPIVTATSDDFAPWRLRNRSQTGFMIQLKDPAETDITFTWVALSSFDPQLNRGSGAALPGAPIPFPVNAFGQPVSSDPVWNGCISGYPVLGGDGQPLSCARYHVDYVWEHPDLGISFTYNPNNEPSVLLIPNGYIVTVVEGSSSSSSSESSVSSSSSSEESSSSSSSSSEPSSGTGSVESSSSSSVSSESSSASSESSESSSVSSESSSSSSESGSGSTL